MSITSNVVRRHSGCYVAQNGHIFVNSEHFTFKLGKLTAYKIQFTGANLCLSNNFKKGVIKPVIKLSDHPSYIKISNIANVSDNKL